MMMHFVYIVTYLGNMLVIEWVISSLIIVWLCTLKKNVANNIDSEAIIQRFQNMKIYERKF